MRHGRWKTSSYTQPNGECVEVRCGWLASAPETAEIRDSKNPDGGSITVPYAAWVAFVTAIKRS